MTNTQGRVRRKTWHCFSGSAQILPDSCLESSSKDKYFWDGQGLTSVGMAFVINAQLLVGKEGSDEKLYQKYYRSYGFWNQHQGICSVLCCEMFKVLCLASCKALSQDVAFCTGLKSEFCFKTLEPDSQSAVAVGFSKRSLSIYRSSFGAALWGVPIICCTFHHHLHSRSISGANKMLSFPVLGLGVVDYFYATSAVLALIFLWSSESGSSIPLEEILIKLIAV